MRRGGPPQGPARQWFASCILFLLLSASVASAATGRPVAADLVVAGPVVLHGAVDAAAEDATVVLVPPADSTEVAVAEAASGALRVVTSRRDVIIGPSGSEHWLPAEHDVQSVPLGAVRAVVREAREDFLGVLTPTGGALRASLATASRALGVEAEPRAYTIGYDAPQPYYFNHEVPAGSFQLASEGAASTIAAPSGLQLALTGAVLEVATAEGLRTFELGDRMEPAESPTGTGPLYRKVTSFAVLALEDAGVVVGDAAGAVLYSRQPRLGLDGRLVLERASGMLTAPGAAANAVEERLRLEGRFTIDAARTAPSPGLVGAGEGETHLRVSGAASQVLIGGKPWALPPDVAEVAAPAALLLAGVIAWLTGLGPKALAAAAAPMFATATPQAMLANDRRRAIYQAVLRTPGIHMRELHRITGMRWGSLQYHTAVLVGTGILVATRAGRRTVLACDAHRLTQEQVRALHLLRSPRALRVARAVASGQARTQRDIALTTGVSFRLVSRYLGVMQTLGLVETTNGNRPKRYAITPRLAELLPHALPEPVAPVAAPADAVAEVPQPSWPPATN